MKKDIRRQRIEAEKIERKLGKRGQFGMSATTGAAVAAAITIIIGLVVIANVAGSISRDNFSAEQNTTFTSVMNNVNSALVLLGVGIIVLGAAAILVIVKLISG